MVITEEYQAFIKILTGLQAMDYGYFWDFSGKGRKSRSCFNSGCLSASIVGLTEDCTLTGDAIGLKLLCWWMVHILNTEWNANCGTSSSSELEFLKIFKYSLNINFVDEVMWSILFWN